MNFPRWARSVLVALGFGAAVPLPIQAAEEPHCGKFQVYSEYVEVEFLDHGEPGVSVGDARYGHGRLFNKNGDEIASVYFHTVIPPGGDGDLQVVLRNGYSIFANGMIFSISAIRIPEPKSAATHSRELEYAIVGGTGDFAGARGTLRAFNDEQGRRVAEYDIVCLK